METHNKFFVSIKGDAIGVLCPPPIFTRRFKEWNAPSGNYMLEMTKPDALLLAAWLVVCADPRGDEFMKLLASIKAI